MGRAFFIKTLFWGDGDFQNCRFSSSSFHSWCSYGHMLRAWCGNAAELGKWGFNALYACSGRELGAVGSVLSVSSGSQNWPRCEREFDWRLQTPVETDFHLGRFRKVFLAVALEGDRLSVFRWTGLAFLVPCIQKRHSFYQTVQTVLCTV